MLHATKNKYILIAVGTLFLSVGAAGYLWFEIQKQGASLVETLQALADEGALEQEYRQLDSMLDQTQSQRERLRSYMLFDEGDAVKMLSEVDQLAATLGVEVSTQSLEEIPVKDSEFDILAVTFEIKGQSQKVTTVLELLESLPYHSSVASFSFVRTADQATGVPQVKAGITLHVSIKK